MRANNGWHKDSNYGFLPPNPRVWHCFLLNSHCQRACGNVKDWDSEWQSPWQPWWESKAVLVPGCIVSVEAQQVLLWPLAWLLISTSFLEPLPKILTWLTKLSGILTVCCFSVWWLLPSSVLPVNNSQPGSLPASPSSLCLLIQTSEHLPSGLNSSFSPSESRLSIVDQIVIVLSGRQRRPYFLRCSMNSCQEYPHTSLLLGNTKERSSPRTTGSEMGSNLVLRMWAWAR